MRGWDDVACEDCARERAENTLGKLAAENRRLQRERDGIELELTQMAERNERLGTALTAIAGFGSVSLAGEWEGGLRDIIRSMTDCANRALKP